MSKGGNSFKEEDRRPFKVMADMFDALYDTNDIKRVEKKVTADPDSDSGVAYSVVVFFHSFPNEKVFNFNSEEDRDMSFLKVKTKLLGSGVVIL